MKSLIPAMHPESNVSMLADLKIRVTTPINWLNLLAGFRPISQVASHCSTVSVPDSSFKRLGCIYWNVIS